MLHARASDALDAAKVQALVAQARQDEVQSLEPHGDGGEDFIFGRVGEHALLDAVVDEVGVEIDDGGVDELQVRGYDQACGGAWRMRVSRLLLWSSIGC